MTPNRNLLFGNFPTDGFAIQHYTNTSGRFDLPYLNSKRDLTLLAVNFGTQIEIKGANFNLKHLTHEAIVLANKEPLTFTQKKPSKEASFCIIEISLAWLSSILDYHITSTSSLKSHLESSQHQKTTIPALMRSMASHLLHPPIIEAAKRIWYQAKLMELVSLLFFIERPIMHSIDLKNIERVSRARTLLDENFQHPPSLDELAIAAECSTFHLCRIFQEEVGTTIREYLQSIRMERAVIHLQSGMPVAKAAQHVGYRNLSAFAKAFYSRYHVLPSRFLDRSSALAHSGTRS